MRPQFRAARVFGVGLLLAATGLAICPPPVPADAVYMKDGFVLHGKVRREADLITDPVTGAVIPIDKPGNFFLIDDRVRFVIFNPKSVENADPEVNIRSDFITLQHPIQNFGVDGRLPRMAVVQNIPFFDAKWNRTVRLLAYNAEHPAVPDPMSITQRLKSLSPYALVVQGQRYPWAMTYQTRELGLENLIKLLDTHTDTQEGPAPDVDRRIRRARFLLQAGWLSAAETELDRAAQDLPKGVKEITERLDRVRTIVRQAQAARAWDDIQLAHKAGRYRYVAATIGKVPADQLTGNLGTELTLLKSKYDAWSQQVKDLDRLLNLVNGQFAGPPAPLVAAAESAIRAGAGPDTLDRLEPFLSIARQYEKELKTGKPPTYAPDDVFALAVTGWVMGREAAEPKVATAERYWASRDFLLAYQRTHDGAGRAKLFDEYQQHNPLTLDEIAQLISLAPPPDPAEPGAEVAPGVEQRQSQVPWTQNPPVPYVLQLPPEYKPDRPYPVLIALHSGGERSVDALSQWSAEAARNGYILAAPDWGGATGYNYSAAEHLVVLDLIKDLRRRYAVDSDRVFLAGYGDGGTMAWDVGLSHPDLFAGVVPVNARPRVSTTYWYTRNAQNLPFYIVCGEMAGNGPNSVNWVNNPGEPNPSQRTMILNRRPFADFMSHSYPSLLVIYKGRAAEFYPAEVPTICDWMNRKRRASGFPELGRNPNTGSRGEEFQSMRATDNHFYWVSIERINERNVNREVGMKVGSPAAVQASVRDGNSVYVNTRGVRTLRLWFGRIWDAQSGWRPMVDFARPVKITANGRAYGRDHAVPPSLRTMLEDLYDRGDRQRLFMAYVDVTNLQ